MKFEKIEITAIITIVLMFVLFFQHCENREQLSKRMKKEQIIAFITDNNNQNYLEYDDSDMSPEKLAYIMGVE